MIPMVPAHRSLGHHRRQFCFLWAQLSRAWGIIGDKFVSYGPSSAEHGASQETNLFPIGPAQPSLGHDRRQICFLRDQLSRALGIIREKMFPMCPARPSLGHHRRQICFLWAELKAWGLIGNKFVSYMGKAQPSLGHRRRQIRFLWA